MDFDFGDLSGFSLGGSPSEGASFGGGYDLGGGADAAPAFADTGGSSFSLGAGGLDQSALPTMPDTSGTGGGGALGAVRGVMQPFADVAKAALPIIGLGTAGMGMAAGIQGAKTSAQNAATMQRGQRLQEGIANRQSAAAAPLTNFGQQQLDASTSGKIPDQIQAQIDQWAQGAKARINDYFARSGQGNSLQLQQKLSEIDQAAKAMGGTFLQEESKLGIQSLSQGANALGGAGNTASTIGQGAAAGNANIATLISEANRALATLEAGAGKS